MSFDGLATHTLVARPWTHQMHIRWSYGNGALTHGLAHLFTAPLVTRSPTGPQWSVAKHRYGQGIAVAAEEERLRAEPSPACCWHRHHAWLVANIELFDTAVWALPAGRAYDSSDICSMVG